MERCFYAGEKVSLGAEHAVFREVDQITGEDTGSLIKFPHRFGGVWQAMRPDLAERDLEKLREYEVPLVPTELCTLDPVVHFPDGREYPAKYVHRQPIVCGGAVGMPDLMRPEIARQVHEIILKGEAMYQRDDLGMDLLGGKALWGAVQALVAKDVTAVVNNLLIDEDDVVRLCDVRLYDFAEFMTILLPFLRGNHNFQYEIMVQVMAERNLPVVRRETFWNSIPRVVAKGVYFLAKDKLVRIEA